MNLNRLKDSLYIPRMMEDQNSVFKTEHFKFEQFFNCIKLRLTVMKLELLEHPHYSSDLALSDYHLSSKNGLVDSN